VAFACALPAQFRKRLIRQQVVVPGDSAHRGLDGVAAQGRVEIFVEQGLELHFGSEVLGLGVHSDRSDDEENSEDATHITIRMHQCRIGASRRTQL
jgi:hypothetical protein